MNLKNTITLIAISSLILFACSSENEPEKEKEKNKTKETKVFIDPQLKALEKAKKVEADLQKATKERMKQVDETKEDDPK